MEVDPDRHLYRSDDSGIVTSVFEDGSGSRYVSATGRLHLTGWLLVVRQAAREAYAPLSRALVIGISIILGGGALVVLTGVLLASGQARQLVLSDKEKRQLGTQLILAGKFAELGEMSVGIAHEINNPLQVMKAEQSLLTILLAELGATAGAGGEDLDMARDSIDQIGIQIDRCKEITQGLLNFSRKSDAVSKTIDLGSLIPEVIRMIEEKAKVEDVRIVHESNPDPPEVVGDPSQLQQVLLNLLNNALYALEGRENGEIRIASTREEDTVTISVADNGCGIDPEIIDKIFLPFFTTKPVGQGTGLGLSTIYGIVERWGGQVRVSSEPDVGSVFTVHLPVPTKTRVFEDRVVHETRGGLGHGLR
jgi:two-component system NtrC family sensor kinase